MHVTFTNHLQTHKSCPRVIKRALEVAIFSNVSQIYYKL